MKNFVEIIKENTLGSIQTLSADKKGTSDAFWVNFIGFCGLHNASNGDSSKLKLYFKSAKVQLTAIDDSMTDLVVSVKAAVESDQMSTTVGNEVTKLLALLKQDKIKAIDENLLRTLCSKIFVRMKPVDPKLKSNITQWMDGKESLTEIVKFLYRYYRPQKIYSEFTDMARVIIPKIDDSDQAKDSVQAISDAKKSNTPFKDLMEGIDKGTIPMDKNLPMHCWAFFLNTYDLSQSERKSKFNSIGISSILGYATFMENISSFIQDIGFDLGATDRQGDSIKYKTEFPDIVMKFPDKAFEVSKYNSIFRLYDTPSLMNKSLSIWLTIFFNKFNKNALIKELLIDCWNTPYLGNSNSNFNILGIGSVNTSVLPKMIKENYQALAEFFQAEPYTFIDLLKSGQSMHTSKYSSLDYLGGDSVMWRRMLSKFIEGALEWIDVSQLDFEVFKAHFDTGFTAENPMTMLYRYKNNKTSENFKKFLRRNGLLWTSLYPSDDPTPEGKVIIDQPDYFFSQNISRWFNDAVGSTPMDQQFISDPLGFIKKNPEYRNRFIKMFKLALNNKTGGRYYPDYLFSQDPAVNIFRKLGLNGKEADEFFFELLGSPDAGPDDRLRLDFPFAGEDMEKVCGGFNEFMMNQSNASRLREYFKSNTSLIKNLIAGYNNSTFADFFLMRLFSDSVKDFKENFIAYGSNFSYGVEMGAIRILGKKRALQFLPASNKENIGNAVRESIVTYDIDKVFSSISSMFSEDSDFLKKYFDQDFINSLADKMKEYRQKDKIDWMNLMISKLSYWKGTNNDEVISKIFEGDFEPGDRLVALYSLVKSGLYDGDQPVMKTLMHKTIDHLMTISDAKTYVEFESTLSQYKRLVPGGRYGAVVFDLVAAIDDDERRKTLKNNLRKFTTSVEYSIGADQYRSTYTSVMLDIGKNPQDYEVSALIDYVSYEAPKHAGRGDWKRFESTIDNHIGEVLLKIYDSPEKNKLNDLIAKFGFKADHVHKRLKDVVLVKPMLEQIVGSNTPIKPEVQLTQEEIIKVLKFNNFQVKTANGKTIRKNKNDTFVDYLDKVVDLSKTGGLSIDDLKATEVDKTPEDLEKMTGELYKYFSPDVKHGDVGVEILKEFSVDMVFPEFDTFAANNPGTEFIPAFHGTGTVGSSMILRFGFKVASGSAVSNAGVSFAGRMLGDGIYFAKYIDKSCGYIRDTKSWSNRRGNVGYLLEMQANLGTKGVNYAAAGEGRDSIRSPEYCVFDPRAQLKIIKAYKVRLTTRSYVQAMHDKHFAATNITAENTQWPQLFKFKDFLMEAPDAPKKNFITVIFNDGRIPVDAENYVSPDDFLAKYADQNKIVISDCQEGIRIDIQTEDLYWNTFVEDTDEFVIDNPEGMFSQYLFWLNKNKK